MNNQEPNEFEASSPDGFPISMSETWKSEQEAQQAIVEWVERYRAQGYYSMSDRTRIPFNEIESYCTVLPLTVS